MTLRGFRRRPPATFPADPGAPAPWPGGARAAISFTFDDALPSAARLGAAGLESHGWRGTFFVLMRRVQSDAALWQEVAAAGHEIGSHTISHPCSGNFPWSRPQALEEYTLERMAAELDASSVEIETFFGRRPVSFAYCCGQKFVGRGVETRSYVPLVAERFAAGRGFRDEFPNDPSFVDLAQIAGIEADGLDRKRFVELAEQAVRGGHWLVFVGHDVARARGDQIVDARELEAFCRWLRRREEVWVAPLGEVAATVAGSRSAPDSS